METAELVSGIAGELSPELDVENIASRVTVGEDIACGVRMLPGDAPRLIVGEGLLRAADGGDTAARARIAGGVAMVALCDLLSDRTRAAIAASGASEKMQPAFALARWAAADYAARSIGSTRDRVLATMGPHPAWMKKLFRLIGPAATLEDATAVCLEVMIDCFSHDCGSC